MEENIQITPQERRLLLAAANGDAALLFLHLCGGGKPEDAPMSAERREEAARILRRLGLSREPEKPLPRADRPVYTETDVTGMLRDAAFSQLMGEAQRQLGRNLSTEELKCLISIRDYLQMPDEVTAILISYCVQRSRARGVRPPSMRSIEKEAFAWADLEIDNVEAAVQYMQAQLTRRSRAGRIAELLQISGRRLVAAEERYVNQWIDWGFPDEAIAMAYEKTCMNTGGLKWPYLHSILSRWEEKGLHSVEEIRAGDSGTTSARRGKAAAKSSKMTDLERKALEQLLGKKET